MDRPVLPDAQIWQGNLNREPTFSEQRFHGSPYTDQYVIAPHVMQILNPEHLLKKPDLTGFSREPWATDASSLSPRTPSPGSAAPTHPPS